MSQGSEEGKCSYQGRSWIRFGIPIHQEVSRSHSTDSETSCIEECRGLTRSGRAERWFDFELNWEVQTSSLLALYKDKQGIVGEKSGFTYELANRRIRDPYVRWCERCSGGRLAVTHLLDCSAFSFYF